MVKKKKTPKNGFYYFMLYVKSKEERLGRNLDMRTVSEMASPMWDDLTLEEKKYYNDLAARKKEEESTNLANKFTSTGISFAQQDQEAREYEEALIREKEDIKQIVNSMVDKDFKEMPFYLIHCNYLYPRKDGGYALAEVGLVEFSLGNGITNSLHSFLDSGPIELGKRFEAREWSARYHKIPIEDPTFDYGEKNFDEIFNKIISMIQRGRDGKIPPFFTLPDNTNRNTSMSACKYFFECLTSETGENPDAFRVYSLHKLLFHLKNRCADLANVRGDNMTCKLASEALAENELLRDVYCHARGLACDHHESLDEGGMYCSLSFAKRWAYYICLHCSPLFQFEMMPWQHYPVGVEDVFDTSSLRRALPRGTTASASAPALPRATTASNASRPSATNSRLSSRPSNYYGPNGEEADLPQRRPLPPAVPYESARMSEAAGPSRVTTGYASRMKASAPPSMVSDNEFPALGAGRDAFPPLGEGPRMSRGRGRILRN